MGWSVLLSGACPWWQLDLLGWEGGGGRSSRGSGFDGINGEGNPQEQQSTAKERAHNNRERNSQQLLQLNHLQQAQGTSCT
ncbi:hypothetical protein MAPG_00111 [Magnaporthiopsis poae ATCC 64411]|uniref:Uncharacterized protein n=1 Tax=Magnaporthiopsis poae (strain ATCC 64411 / 73-15) TaxID=644358 RepID=A0A0C4DK49_MAGP6|nr:hypothetical protein MAPG_00111 [Magnaporthiopsis poae ATCC 64411]